MSEQAIPKPIQNLECTFILHETSAKNGNSTPRPAHT